MLVLVAEYRLYNVGKMIPTALPEEQASRDAWSGGQAVLSFSSADLGRPCERVDHISHLISHIVITAPYT